MDKFTKLTGVAAPLPIVNVDTDMIIPKDYLKTIKRTGLGTGLFAEMRYIDDGSENPDFVLNKPAYRKAQILVAGDNFGCGSSREHAPWALLDFGIRCVISTSLRRHFLQQLLQERHPADHRQPRRSGEAAGRRLARLQRDDLDRSRGQGNPRAGWRRRQVRPRRVQAPLPAQRPRRYRAHHGEGAVDRPLREAARRKPALGVTAPVRPADRSLTVSAGRRLECRRP